MNWIIFFLQRNERASAVTISLLLIVLNAGSLYFIIDLMSYDEMVGYLDDGGLKISNPHNFVFGLLITMLLNTLFVFGALCSCFTKSK